MQYNTLSMGVNLFLECSGLFNFLSVYISGVQIILNSE